MRAAFVSVVPSPYQRDLFRALAAEPGIDLQVYYLESASPDSPWPEKPLESFERILPGGWFSIGKARCHLNWSLPDLRQFDMVAMNTLMSLTGQWLMRTQLRNQPWIFWGERLSGHGNLHSLLTAPLRRCSAIAAIGSIAETDYRQRFPMTRVFSLPYFCDLDPFLAAPRSRASDEPVTFLFCGQMIARKGIDILLEAFQRLQGDARLLLVGREADLPRLLGSMNTARDRVTYAGFQSPEQLPRFFAQADVFVLPSRHDGWGVVVNQALGAGLPILCSDGVGAGYDLVENEVNGLRFPTGDAAALASAMQRFIDHRELCQSWGDASRARAADWSPRAGAAKWREAFHSVLAS